MVTRTALDPATARQDFPILQRLVNGRPLAYLDNGATTQKPQAVLDALDRYYRETNANVHRGVHTLSVEATDAMEAARVRVQHFLGAADSREIVFTRGTTEAINLVAWSWGLATLRPGDEILLTVLEHHSNIVPWQLVAERTGARIVVCPRTPDGEIDPARWEAALSGRTRLAAFVHMSNVLGSIAPARQLIDAAHRAGALVLVDGAQSVPHLPVDVQALDCDFLAFSGHKMYAPTGIGVLYGKRHLLEAMPPWQGGGDMIRTVSFAGSTWNDLPWKFEAGTPDIAGAIGLGAAVDYVERFGMEAIREHEVALTAFTLDILRSIPGVTVPGPAEASRRGGVISFLVDSIHPHDLGTILDEQGIAIRAGHHCAQPLMEDLGVPATARASFALYTTQEDVLRLADGIQRAQRLFRTT